MRVRGASQASSDVISDLGELLEVAAGIEEALAQPLDQRGRGLVGNEVAREFARDVLCGRGMAREIGEHAAALLDAGVVVTLSDHGLRARLMHARIEIEFAAAARDPAAAGPRSSR